MDQHAKRHISGKKIVLVMVLSVVALVVGSVYYTLGVVRRTVSLQYSETQMIVILRGLQSFALDHGERFPTPIEWPDALINDGTIDEIMLTSPHEDGDGVSYIYVPGPFTSDETQILIYEDPKHWPKQGVLVGFADAHVEFVPFGDFDHMLAAQLESNAEVP